MCTIGAVQLSDSETLLFKNKDFAEVGYSDKLSLNESYFGPLGLETFGEAGKLPVFSGLSLGANKYGLMACVNHVKSTSPRSLNYDLLVQDVVAECQSVDEAIECIERLVGKQSYWWGNLILADKCKTAVAEVRDYECRTHVDKSFTFRTNHQPLFEEVESLDGIECSAQRYQSVEARLSQVCSVEDMISMLSTHDDQDGSTGICNHTSSLKTVYSYLLHQKEGALVLYVCKGNPCAGSWEKLQVPVGKLWSQEAEQRFRHRYPT
jgi:predicted choloylglycine hydrolase